MKWGFDTESGFPVLTFLIVFFLIIGFVGFINKTTPPDEGQYRECVRVWERPILNNFDEIEEKCAEENLNGHDELRMTR